MLILIGKSTLSMLLSMSRGYLATALQCKQCFQVLRKLPSTPESLNAMKKHIAGRLNKAYFGSHQHSDGMSTPKSMTHKIGYAGRHAAARLFAALDSQTAGTWRDRVDLGNMREICRSIAALMPVKVSFLRRRKGQ